MNISKEFNRYIDSKILSYKIRNKVKEREKEKIKEKEDKIETKGKIINKKK